MVAPAVPQCMLTFWSEEYVPPFGVNVGTAAFARVKVAVETELLFPSFMAIADTVVVAEMLKGALYRTLDALGVLPSVV